jgi:hypothetical protein
VRPRYGGAFPSQHPGGPLGRNSPSFQDWWEAMELAESHLILLVLGTALAILGVLFWLYW